MYFQEFIEEDRPELADYWGKKFNDRLKLVENELKMKNTKTKDSNRFGMLRDVLDEKSSESPESFTDTPTTLTDNAEETIMIKGRVSRTVFSSVQWSVTASVNSLVMNEGRGNLIKAKSTCSNQRN